MLLINQSVNSISAYNPKKKNLPKRSEFHGVKAWLSAVQKEIGHNVIFALDEALMCQGNFLGRIDEYIIWVYTSEDMSEYNGIVVLGSNIDDFYIDETDGLKYTNFNRTLEDALANENILDMQGITEALSNYYYSHNQSFDGIYVSPKYISRFRDLANDAVNYYNT